MNTWRDTAQTWQPIPAPVYQPGDEAYIRNRGYRFVYFSPMRPLAFVLGLDCVITQSTEPHHEYLFARTALSWERVERWELVPIGDTWQAYEETAR